VRHLKNGAGTFDRIMSNIRDAVNEFEEFRVSIRMNVGKSNRGAFSRFADILEEYRIRDRISLVVTQMESFKHLCDEAIADAMTTEEFSAAYLEIAGLAVEKGISMQVISDRTMSRCSSTKKDGFLIDQDGRLYKCWNVIGNLSESVGAVDRDVKLNEGSLKWLAWDIYRDDMCRSCSILPLCMGGCPRKTLVGSKIVSPADKCLFLKYNFPELVKIYYRQRVKYGRRGGRHEGIEIQCHH
jgi:uncharacterized protein